MQLRLLQSFTTNKNTDDDFKNPLNSQSYSKKNKRQIYFFNYNMSKKYRLD